MVCIKGIDFPDRCEECRFYNKQVGMCDLTRVYTLRHRGMEKPDWCQLESVEVETKTKDDAFHDGQWSMFKMISAAWYGKQCYCDTEDGVYSRLTGKTYNLRRDAVREFMNKMADTDSYTYERTVGEDMVDR